MGEIGLELGDPGGELGGLEVLVVLLEGIGADPEEVGDQAAETAEGDGGEGEHRRGVVEGGGVGETEAVAVGVQEILDLAGADQQGDGQAQEQDFFGAGVHWVPWAVASSRRLKRRMPARPMTPPSNKTIWAKAAPSSLQGMARPVLRSSMGE